MRPVEYYEINVWSKIVGETRQASTWIFVEAKLYTQRVLKKFSYRSQIAVKTRLKNYSLST